MKKLLRKYLIAVVIILITLITACQRSSLPATPDASELLLWENKDATSVIKTRLGNGATYALAISPNGEMLAVAGAGGLAAYNFNTLKELWRSPLELYKEVPHLGVALTWSPDGSRLATSSAGDVSIWDANTGKLLSKPNNSEHYITSVAWSPDEQVLAAGTSGDKPMIILWETQIWKKISTLETSSEVKSLDWKTKGRILAALIGNQPASRSRSTAFRVGTKV